MKNVTTEISPMAMDAARRAGKRMVSCASTISVSPSVAMDKFEEQKNATMEILVDLMGAAIHAPSNFGIHAKR